MKNSNLITGDRARYALSAITLGLSGEINKKQYLNVMKGKLPSGWKFLTAKKVNPHKRRVATDFTFSTPKSISLQALVMGDTRLIEAHRVAVKTAIALQSACCCREWLTPVECIAH